MPLEHERSFSADSPVGRYWLRNCVGFQVRGLRGGSAVVEEVGLGSDGVDVLAVRRRLGVRTLVLVPVQRVESVLPWDDTIVLASRRRRSADRRQAPAHGPAQVVHGALGAIRQGTTLASGLLGAAGTLLLGIAVVVRRYAAALGALLAQVARAYASEARRAWRAERDAIAVWRASRREYPDEPGDEAPLTRADDDALDRTREERLRR
jgi:hypothetical protein